MRYLVFVSTSVADEAGLHAGDEDESPERVGDGEEESYEDVFSEDHVEYTSPGYPDLVS